MRTIIIIGDCHAKGDPVYFGGLRQVFKGILDAYPGSILVSTGDLLDTSSPHYEEVLDPVLEILSNFHHVHWVGGNHEDSHLKGNLLKPINRYPNITTYLEPTEVAIEGMSFYMLPHLKPTYRMRAYEAIEWKGDFVVAHVAPIGKNHGASDEVDLSKMKALRIYGHIHEPAKLYKGKRGEVTDLILGVPQQTRFGEHIWDFQYYLIDPKTKTHGAHPIPQYWTFEEVEYGDEPKSKNNVLVVKNAPSVNAAFTFYDGYRVHKDKIELLRSLDAEETTYSETKDALNFSLSTMFHEFLQVNSDIPLEIQTELRTRLNSY